MTHRQRAKLTPWGLLLGDGLCIFLAYAVAIYLSAPVPETRIERFFTSSPYLAVFVVIWFGTALDERLWSIRGNQSINAYLYALLKAVGNAALFCVFIMIIFRPEGVEREFLAAFCLATLAILVSVRAAIRLVFWKLRDMGFDIKRTILIGANDRTAKLLMVLGSRGRYGYQVEGFLEDDPERAKSLKDLGLPHLGAIDTLGDVLRNMNIDEVYVALPVRSHYESIQHIASYCEGAGVPVHLLADLFPLRIATSRLMHIQDIPLLSLSTIPEAYFKLVMKRVIDFFGSTALIVALSPMLATLAMLVKLDSTGPILFGQERVGQNQRRFKMLKFRSMVVNAEELRKKLEAQNEADGPVFKMKNDPRVTRLGRFIRRYSLDEFPQLFNVWKGEMSLVGPRPPIPSEVEQYSWDQRRRLSVKPGMTGPWQVSGRNLVGFEEWVEMDLAYIDNWNLTLDFIILLKTFRAVVRGRGAS
ncbi:MAG: sugar transferase [Candidatus Hydrogenedentes bacterium]|nr:sugar transferase [Candidatus Hydrogenedentota bacterium]